jgi:hypothetical protein
VAVRDAGGRTAFTPAGRHRLLDPLGKHLAGIVWGCLADEPAQQVPICGEADREDELVAAGAMISIRSPAAPEWCARWPILFWGALLALHWLMAGITAAAFQ